MRHIAVINKKPELSGKQSTPDGAINGNGDLGIILGNQGNGMRIYISKNDLWYGVERYDSGGIKPLGYIDIDIPETLYKNYYVEQDMDNGELRCKFENGEKCCEIHTRVCKAENAVMIESVGNFSVNPVLKVFEGQTQGEKGSFSESGCEVIYRSFAGAACAYETHCYGALKKVSDNMWYLFVATNHDTENPKEYAVEKTRNIDEIKYDNLIKEHYSLWRKFWSKSSFTLSDEELELGWYASQYFLACSAGNEKFPPGIFGNFITVEYPSWHGDYHLNYNYQAPFYAACSSNHVEFTDCYHAPLEEFMKKGRKLASVYKCRGIIYPVGISPKGLCSELNKDLKYWFERLFLGQKSNAIHPADIMVFRWKTTRDTEYAQKHAYPYIKECLEFFEDYAVFENGRYTVKQDAAHEVPYYKPDFKEREYKRYINDTNNILTLGMLRMCLEAGTDMAKTLGVDVEKQKKWQDMLNNLSPFPTYYRNFKKVYRYTEKGMAWHGDNDVGLQHIYPAGCIGLSSDSETLKIARNTFEQKAKYCYLDGNAVCSFFPMAARLGIDAKVIIQKLHEHNSKILLPNMLFLHGGGCLEDCSIVANTLNEMVLQSHDGVLRLFPCWDNGIDVAFENLRAYGAFLVTSSVKNGKIGVTTVFSEKGEHLEMIMPYKNCKVQRNGEIVETSGNTISLDTSANDVITVEEK